MIPKAVSFTFLIVIRIKTIWDSVNMLGRWSFTLFTYELGLSYVM